MKRAARAMLIYIVVFLIALALAPAFATDLAPVSPPIDWLGVAIVSVLGLIFVAIAGYIVHIKRTPGQQLGEAQLEWLAQRLHNLQHEKAVVVTTTDPLFFDGITFSDAAALEQYKAAKAIVDSHRKETP